MKKTLLIFGLLLSFAFLYAQNAPQNGALKNVTPAERAIAQQNLEALSIAPIADLAPFAQTSTISSRGNQEVVLFEPFSSPSLPAGWITLDVDGDGYTWQFTQTAQTCETLYPEGHGDTYSINSGSYYNCVGALYPNNWLITPALELGANTTIKWWVRVIDAAYSYDHYGVYISTTGTNPSDFTLLFEETLTSAQLTWTERTTTTTTGGSNCYIAFRHFNSSDVYIFCIDDVEVSTEGVGTTYCPAVTNVSAVQAVGTSAKITWTAPSVTTDLTGYKIYEGTTEIGTTTVGTTTFITNALSAGEHTFGVAAVYDEECEPKKVTATVTIKTCGGAITGVEVEYDANCKATVSWDAVGKGRDYEGWIKYCVSDEIVGRVGWSATSGNDMTACIRFLPSDLAALGVESGQVIDKIALGFGTELAFVNTMEIRIWQGGTSITDPGTLEYTFPLAGPFGSYPENTIAEFEIDPYTIDASRELRIGWNLVNTQGYPQGRDGGPNVPGKGMIFYCADYPVSGWIDAAAVYGWYYNWIIKAWVTEGGVQESKYNVYKGTVLVAGGIEETTWTDTESVTVGVDIDWCVVQACSNGGESEAGCVTLMCGTPCEPITNPEGTLDITTANITWTAVEGATKYEVTRDGKTETVTTNAYTETGEFVGGESYTWEIVTVCGEQKTDPVPVTLICNNINDIALSLFTIVPNPAQNEITISAAISFNTVEVINFLGQTVISQINNAQTVKLDISNLNNGVYFVRLVSENGTSVKKFVKQ